jgi:cytidine deaminase
MFAENTHVGNTFMHVGNTTFILMFSNTSGSTDNAMSVCSSCRRMLKSFLDAKLYIIFVIRTFFYQR